MSEQTDRTQSLVRRASDLRSGPYLDVPADYVAQSAGPPFGTNGFNEPKVSGIYEYWRVLWIQKGTVALITLTGLLLGIAVAFLAKPVYRAKTAVEVLNINEDFFFNKQTTPLSETDVNSDTSELQTQVRILSDDGLLDKVIVKLSPRHQSGFMRGEYEARGRDELLAKAAKTLKVQAVGRTRVIEVSIDSTDAKLAAAFANTLISEFVTENLDAKWKGTERTSEWLSHELESTRGKLQHSEDALQAYARNSGILFSGDNTSVSEEKLKQLQQELSTVTAERIARQSRFELVQSASVDTLPDIANNQDLAAARAKIVDLKRQAADLSTVYTPDYSKVKRLEAETGTLEAAFASEKETIVSRIRNDYAEAVRRERLLRDAYSAQTQEVTRQGEKAVQYNVLKREVQSNQQLYDNMLQLLKQSRVASAMRASNIRVLEAASIPWRPHSPGLLIKAAAGLVLGFIGAVLFTVMRRRADRTIQDPGEVRLWIDVPELGVVPAAKRLAESIQQTPVTGAKPGKANAGARLRAEVFRTIATSVLFNAATRSLQVLIVTSASASDGKSTVTSSLGFAMAGIRKRVLVIDGDLRCPALHKRFALENKEGLSDLLEKPESQWGSFSETIHRTGIDGLELMTAGSCVGDVGFLLHSPALHNLLKKMRLRYDVILIDTPPILPVSDARIVGRLADAAILVARAEQTTREALSGAKDQLSDDGIRVLGAVLNDWNPERSIHGHFGLTNKSYYQAYERYLQAG